eukprot:3781651-Rhodomonas_salina.1
MPASRKCQLQGLLQRLRCGTRRREARNEPVGEGKIAMGARGKQQRRALLCRHRREREPNGDHVVGVERGGVEVVVPGGLAVRGLLVEGAGLVQPHRAHAWPTRTHPVSAALREQLAGRAKPSREAARAARRGEVAKWRRRREGGVGRRCRLKPCRKGTCPPPPPRHPPSAHGWGGEGTSRPRCAHQPCSASFASPSVLHAGPPCAHPR